MFFITMLTISVAEAQKKKSWRDKDIRDMTDADLEHLLEQWEVWPFVEFSNKRNIRFLSLYDYYINKINVTWMNFLIVIS